MRRGGTSATQTCGAEGEGGSWGAAALKLAMSSAAGCGPVRRGAWEVHPALWKGWAGMEKQNVGILAKLSGVQGGVSVPAWET